MLNPKGKQLAEEVVRALMHTPADTVEAMFIKCSERDGRTHRAFTDTFVWALLKIADRRLYDRVNYGIVDAAVQQLKAAFPQARIVQRYNALSLIGAAEEDKDV